MTIPIHPGARQPRIPRRNAAPAQAPGAAASKPLFTIMGRDGFRVLDQVAIIVWFMSMTFYTPLRPLFLYACCGYFVAGLLLHGRQFGPMLIRCWPMFILPVLALISMLWAPSGMGAMRKSLLLAMTGIVAIYFAGRLSPRQIIYSIFGVLWLAGVASAIQPDYVGDAATGIYDQKNLLAVNMFYLWVASLILMMDKNGPRSLRLLACIGGPVAIYLIVISQSATNLVITILATAGLMIQHFIWNPAGRVAHMRAVLALTVAVLGLVATFVLFGLVQADYFAMLLEALGKDSTLTGRTVLWETARRVMEERPWTGMGAEGFWRPEVGAANTLVSFLHFEQFTALTFHNSYFENGVSFGYPGYYGTMFLAAWCGLMALRTWLRDQSTFNGYFVVVALLTILRSQGESDFSVEFGAVMIFIAAARGALPAPPKEPLRSVRAAEPPRRPQRIYRARPAPGRGPSTP